VDWYRAFYEQGASLHQVTTEQIGSYADRATSQGLAWTA
jgi:hypothetical protein